MFHLQFQGGLLNRTGNQNGRADQMLHRRQEKKEQEEEKKKEWMGTEGVCGAVLMEFSSSPFAEETNNIYGNCHFGGICTGKLHCKLIFDRTMEKLLFKPLFLHLENIFLESLIIYFKHVLHKPAAVEGHCSLLQCCSFPTSIHPNFRLLCYCQQLPMREINLN